jgi:hypothetical protein
MMQKITDRGGRSKRQLWKARSRKRNVKKDGPKNHIFKIFKSMLNPAVWQAVATIGILFLAIYGAFFSNFSKAVERSLLNENTDLKIEKRGLELEIADITIAIGEQTRILNEKEYNRKAAEVEIDKLIKSRDALLKQQNSLKDSLTQSYVEYSLYRSPSNTSGTGLSRLAVYLLNLMTEKANREIQGDNSRSDREINPSVLDISKVAYREMQDFLSEIETEAESTFQKEAVNELQNRFHKNCPSFSGWSKQFEALKPISELSIGTNYVSTYLDTYRDAQSVCFEKNQVDH